MIFKRQMISTSSLYSQKRLVIIYRFSDNLRYGIKFAKKFIDAPDKRLLKKTGEIRNLMNLHNNEAGRRVGDNYFDKVCLTQIFTQAIARLMLMKCRCHGVSGSCEFKTCWKSLPQFAEIGKYLKSKYDKSAVKVRVVYLMHNACSFLYPETELYSILLLSLNIYKNSDIWKRKYTRVFKYGGGRHPCPPPPMETCPPLLQKISPPPS